MSCDSCINNCTINLNHEVCNKCLLINLPFFETSDEEFASINTFQISANYNKFNHLLFNPFQSNYNPIDNVIDPDSNYFEKQSDILNKCTYFLEDDFNNKLAKDYNSNNFSLFHLNVRSLNKHFDAFETYINLLKVKFSVIALSETWVHEDLDTSSFNIPGYLYINNFRASKSAGGVGFFIKENLKYTVREDLCTAAAESLFIECNLEHGKKAIIGVIYRHPSDNLESFILNLEELLTNLDKEGKTVWLTGDLNINLLNSDHNLTSSFLEQLFSFSYYPLISKPTRITSHTATLIDHIFTNSLDCSIISGLIPFDISDHFGIFSLTNFNFKTTNKPKFTLKRIFNDKNIKDFTNSISSLDWSSISSNNSSDEAYCTFISSISETFEKHFPLKKIKCNTFKKRKPWLSLGLIVSCKKRTKLFFKYKSKPTNYRLNKYKTYRNKLNRLLRVAKREYFSNHLELAKHDLKQT